MSERATPHVRKFLGQRLRTLRKWRKLSQEALGQRARLSGKFVGEVERGEKSISVDSLYRVAASLRVPLALLTSDGTSPRSVPNADAERILVLALDAQRIRSIRRAYDMLLKMLGKPPRSRNRR